MWRIHCTFEPHSLNLDISLWVIREGYLYTTSVGSVHFAVQKISNAELYKFREMSELLLVGVLPFFSFVFFSLDTSDMVDSAWSA